MRKIHRALPFLFAVLMLFGASAVAAEPPQSCKEPDSSLLKTRGAYSGRAQMPDGDKIEMYNAQARAFNACTKKLIDGNNDAMDRLRDEANARIRDITDTANRQMAATADKAQANVIAAAANAEIRLVADDARARIAALGNTVRGGIAASNAAALARAQIAEGTPLAASDGILQARSAADPLQNDKADPRLWPVLQNTPTGEGVARAITCRAPQQLADSHRMGPKICKRNGVWAALYRAGKDLGPDGKTVTRFDVAQRSHPDVLRQSE